MKLVSVANNNTAFSSIITFFYPNYYIFAQNWTKINGIVEIKPIWHGPWLVHLFTPALLFHIFRFFSAVSEATRSPPNRE